MNLAHLDPAVLSALRDIMGSDYSLLVDTYLNDSAQRLARLNVQADAQALRDGAHSFKGSSSNMGATHLAHLCCELEHLPLDAPAQVAADLLAQINAEFTKVRDCFLSQLAG